MRPQVSVYIAVSLDQYIARLDGGIDWLHTVQVEGEDYGYAAFFETVDALVIGRATYDTVLGFGSWPYAGKRVVVVSHRPFDVNNGEERHSGALAPLMDRLGAEGVRRVYLDGGVLVQQGLAEALVNDMTLSVVPITLGQGRRLFGDTTPERSWTLEGATTYASGLVQLRYR